MQLFYKIHNKTVSITIDNLASINSANSLIRIFPFRLLLLNTQSLFVTKATSTAMIHAIHSRYHAQMKKRVRKEQRLHS